MQAYPILVSSSSSVFSKESIWVVRARQGFCKIKGTYFIAFILIISCTVSSEIKVFNQKKKDVNKLKYNLFPFLFLG